MFISQYNNRITRGVFQLDANNLSDMFPYTNTALIDYLVRRDYANAKDKRYVLMTVGNCNSQYGFDINAVSKLREGDEFSEECGIQLVKRQLHRKALRFADKFASRIEKEVLGLEQVIRKMKTTELKSYIGYKPTYYISDKTSVATFAVPYKALDIGEPSIAGIVDGIILNMWVRLHFRKRVTPLENEIIASFLHDFRSELENEIFNYSGIFLDRSNEVVLRVKVSRFESDEHDPKFAQRALDGKMCKAWWKLNRKIQNLAIGILSKQATHPNWDRWRKAIQINNDKCQKLGV